MLRVGIVGVGFMGMVHYLSYQRLHDVKVTAICDRSEAKRQGDWTSIQGNFGPAGTQMNLQGVNAYGSIDDLLSDPNIDLIDICLPPKFHAPVAIKALKASKAVFCEKPISLSCNDANQMIDVADEQQQTLLIGHVLLYFSEYAWARSEILSGKHGRLLGGSFKRIISNPAWLKNYWSADEIGGPLFDLHVHDAHFIRTLFGMPKQIKSVGRCRNELPEFWHSFFEYDKKGKGIQPTVEVTSGVVNQTTRPFQHAFEIHCEKSTLMFDFAVIDDEPRYLISPTILHESGEIARPDLGDGDPMEAFYQEIKEVVEITQQGSKSDLLDASLARDAILLCETQRQSLQKGTAMTPEQSLR